MACQVCCTEHAAVIMTQRLPGSDPSLLELILPGSYCPDRHQMTDKMRYDSLGSSTQLSRRAAIPLRTDIAKVCNLH